MIMQIQGPEGKFKVVPSLDGGLFKWNDQEVEPVPFSADTLLSSSFKLYDDMVMVGGKESITYGVNANTGKVRKYWLLIDWLHSQITIKATSK